MRRVRIAIKKSGGRAQEGSREKLAAEGGADLSKQASEAAIREQNDNELQTEAGSS